MSYPDGLARNLSNQKAEEALLGALFVNNDAINEVPFLEPHHFNEPLNRGIPVWIE